VELAGMSRNEREWARMKGNGWEREGMRGMRVNERERAGIMGMSGNEWK